MKIDLHCHSKYSHDTYFEPEVLIKQAINMDLDGVCFTEHHSFNASRPVEKIKIPEGFFIFRGTEISTDHGHLLAYGLKDDSWNSWPGSITLNIFDVIKSVHDHGGICVPAHPYRVWDSLGEDIFKIDGFDAIETHNGRNIEEENQKAIKAAQCNKLPSIGGSDCHHLEEVGRAFTVFNNPVHTIDELIEEVKKGNCQGTSI